MNRRVSITSSEVCGLIGGYTINLTSFNKVRESSCKRFIEVVIGVIDK